MTPAPSSPVPAVEADLSNFDLLNTVVRVAADLERGNLGDLCAAVLTRMSTPTPGRAAEPDTMGELSNFIAVSPYREPIPEDIIESIRKGQPAIIGACLGFGIALSVCDEQKIGITVDTNLTPVGEAQLQWMEDIAITWLKKAAPRKLAMGGSDV